MGTLQIGEKIVLLLSPQRLQTDFSILCNLHISRPNGKMHLVESDIDFNVLKKKYPDLPKQARDIFISFHPLAVQRMKEDIKKQFKVKRAGVGFQAFFKNAMNRRLHALMHELKPFSVFPKWYHSVTNASGQTKTAPCRFGSCKPRLQFEVTKDGEELGLEIYVTLNDAIIPYKNFRRFNFLLESENEYYVLPYKDYQILEWLDENNPRQWSRQPLDFANNVLAKLETDYTVNRNNVFVRNQIDAIPVSQVMLSEISNSFLVLTPQWLYDGFIVEGRWQQTTEIVRNGETYVICRNQESENAFLRKLESLHSNFPKQLNGYYYLSFQEAAKKQWFLKVYHSLLDQDIELFGMDMLQHFRYSPFKASTKTSVLKEEIDTITLSLQVFFGDEQVILPELQKMLLSGARSVLLKDGSLGVLTDEWLQRYGLIIKHGKILNKELVVPKWLAYTEREAIGVTSVFEPVINKDWSQRWLQWQERADVVIPVPQTVQATLRTYQHKGFEWLALLAEVGAGACLADDMGLGKTLQTICFLAYRLDRQASAQHLIICPSSLIYNWQQELQKFAPGIPTLIYHGPGRDVSQMNTSEGKIIITSYGTIRSDIEEVSSIMFDVVVLDESHNIKNPDAQVTKAVGKLKAPNKIALSGTPVMNNTFDLYAQLNFLLPGMLGGKEFFKREYAGPIDQDHDHDKIRVLHKLTAPFVLRRTKEQVAPDLPAKTQMVMWVNMRSGQKQLYEEIKSNIRENLFLNIKSEGLNKSKLAVLQGILKLRQICNSPLLLTEGQHCLESAKTEILIDELCNNLQNHKVLVFSQFTRMLDILSEELKKRGFQFYHFDGQTPPAKRAEMVAGFQAPGCTANVFLLSLKAGNSGLNLTAADYVFLFDPWWNTAVQQQAIDRTHRIGQSKNVFAYSMICKDTIEEKIIELQKRKKQLADDLISEENGFVKSLTEDDIDYLFS